MPRATSACRGTTSSRRAPTEVLTERRRRYSLPCRRLSLCVQGSPTPSYVREGQREASLNLIGATIPRWRGVPSATSVDRKSRSLDRCTGNSPCSRRVIWGTPSRPTRPIRAGRRTPVRAPPSAQRFRSIRCARPTRRHLVRIHRKWRPAVLRLQGQRRGRWIMRLPRRASLLLILSLLTSAATAYAECAWVMWVEWASVACG